MGADEKLRAVSYKECAHMALDVARNDAIGRGAELAKQLERRRLELRCSLSSYLQVECLRLEAAREWMEAGLSPAGVGEGADAEKSTGCWEEAVAVAEEAWRGAQKLSTAVQLLLDEDVIFAKTRLEVGPAEAVIGPPLSSKKSMQGDDRGIRDAEGARLSVEAQEEFFVRDGAR